MRGHTASTHRGWDSVITKPHHGRRAQTGRRPGVGPGGTGKAGVPIRDDFQLSEEIGERRTRVVGDDDVVTVHDGTRFVAVAPDDNS